MKFDAKSVIQAAARVNARTSGPDDRETPVERSSRDVGEAQAVVDHR
jgi:hypothetical protein